MESVDLCREVVLFSEGPLREVPCINWYFFQIECKNDGRFFVFIGDLQVECNKTGQLVYGWNRHLVIWVEPPSCDMGGATIL